MKSPSSTHHHRSTSASCIQPMRTTSPEEDCTVVAAHEAARFLSDRLQPDKGVKSSFFLIRNNTAAFLRNQGRVRLADPQTLKQAWRMFVTRRTSFADYTRNRLKESIVFDRLRSLSNREDVDPGDMNVHIRSRSRDLAQTLGFLRWPVSLDTENANGPESSSMTGKETTNLPGRSTQATGRKRKSRSLDVADAIASHVQPMLMCITNSYLLRLHDGMDSNILSGCAENSSTPERFAVKNEFDGSILLALHAAANAAFEPDDTVLDVTAETASDLIDVSFRKLVRTFVLVEMLLGVSGRSVLNSSDNRNNSRMCLVKGLKQTLKKHARITPVKELQDVCAMGRKASIHVYDDAESPEDEKSMAAADCDSAGEYEEDDF